MVHRRTGLSTQEFILQGFTDRTHAAAIKELFDVPEIERVILSVGFINDGGVRVIEPQLRENTDKIRVFAGIRNDITSHQGLARLMRLSDEVYTVDTGRRKVIFHPKLYLVRGRTQARLVLGSDNLTLGGLNNNVEAGLMLHLDLENEKDKDLVDRIESQLDELPTDYPAHVCRVDTTGVLDDMLAAGRIIDEMAIPPPRPATSARNGGTNDTIPPITLKVPPRYDALRAARPRRRPARANNQPEAVSLGVDLELVWESKPLTRRDLSIPNAAGTHFTGSINLDKGLLQGTIDHRHYFRDRVFADLEWAPRSRTVDEAYGQFHLVLKGISYGTFDLAVHHTNSTTSAAYQQHNAMTRLSWGPIRTIIARADLIGRNLALYRDKADPTYFVLEID